MFLLTKPKTRFLILPLTSDKKLETLWKILILFASPFLLQCCCSHIALQSHVNIAEGKGHAYIGISRIFGEDCRFVIFCNQNEHKIQSWTHNLGNSYSLFFFQHDGLSRNYVENFVIGNSNSANIFLALVLVTHELQRKEGISV